MRAAVQPLPWAAHWLAATFAAAVGLLLSPAPAFGDHSGPLRPSPLRAIEEDTPNCTLVCYERDPDCEAHAAGLCGRQPMNEFGEVVPDAPTCNVIAVVIEDDMGAELWYIHYCPKRPRKPPPFTPWFLRERHAVF